MSTTDRPATAGGTRRRAESPAGQDVLVDPASSVDHLVAVLGAGAGFSDSVVGQTPVDLLAHGLQCAQLLALWRPEDVELHVAGLVHDIGHLVAPGRQAVHGVTGAEFVGQLLGRRVAELVRLHVASKRYLATVEPDYQAQLSGDSVASLALQGGLLSPRERAELEGSAYFADAVLLRRADEQAKDPEAGTGELADWVPAITAIAEAHTG